jgi:hypothetical protein
VILDFAVFSFWPTSRGTLHLENVALTDLSEPRLSEQACSFQWWGGTTVLLSAAPARGSAFAGWSGACTGKHACSLSLGSDKSVKATFSRCKVPRLVGQKLKTAKSRITKAYCRVGKITKKKSSRRKRGRVLKQSLRPGKLVSANTKIKLTVGK